MPTSLVIYIFFLFLKKNFLVCNNSFFVPSLELIIHFGRPNKQNIPNRFSQGILRTKVKIGRKKITNCVTLEQMIF